MAACTNSETTNNTDAKNTEQCNTDAENTEQCVCKVVWKQFIDELDSMKDWLMECVEDHPRIINDVLRKLEMKNEETCREINEIIRDAIDGVIESENSGCDSLDHHDL